MKRSALITLGAMIILLMVGMWVYLLIYGTPKQASDVFTNLGVSTNSGAVRVMDIQSTPTTTAPTTLPTNQSVLQQLTTRTIAGFRTLVDEPATIVYMEKGTGHIYKINTTAGTEVLVSTFTIPGAQQAVFSPDGNSFVVTIFDGSFAKSSFGTVIDATETKLYPLRINARNIVFKDSATVLYTTEELGVTIAYTFKKATLAQTKLFTIPFTDVVLHWGSDVSGMYVLPKPTAGLLGYVYRLSETGVLTPLPETGYGLTYIPGKSWRITSYTTGGTYSSDATGEKTLKQPFAMFNEKCVIPTGNDSVIWCAAPLTPVRSSYLEDWYKGIQSSDDYLWYTNIAAQSATLIADLRKLSGTLIDVTGIQINSTGTQLLFENKSDDTLWMYQIPKERQ